MDPPQATPTKRKAPPEPIFSPPSPDTLITPPQPLRLGGPVVQDTPAVSTSPRPIRSLSPIRRLSKRHEYSPKTPTALSRPPLTLPPSPRPGEDDATGHAVESNTLDPLEDPPISYNRVPPVWGWDPELESASSLDTPRNGSLFQFFGEPFVPSLGSTVVTEEEEHQVFGRPLAHVDEDEDEEDFEVTPFVLSAPGPDESPPPSPRPDSSPTLGAEDDSPAFSGHGLEESVRAFEASLANRRSSTTSEPAAVRIEEVAEDDIYGAAFTTPRPRLPLRVTNPSPPQAEPLSPSDFLRHARAIAQYTFGRRLGTPLPPHRRSFSLPERPCVALDSPPQTHTRPILTNTISKSSAEQFGWSDKLQAIAPDALARNQRQRRRSRSEAPITDIIIRGWVDSHFDDLQAAFHEADRKKLAESKRRLEQENMPTADDGVMGLGLGQRRIARVPVPALDIEDFLPEAVPMTRSASPRVHAEVPSSTRHRPTPSHGDLYTAPLTASSTGSAPISALLGRSEVSLWLTQQRHARQTEVVRDKARSRSRPRQRDVPRSKEPGLPSRKGRYRTGSPGGPRPMTLGTGSTGEVDLRTLKFEFPSTVPTVSSQNSNSAVEAPEVVSSPASCDTQNPIESESASPRDKGKGKAKALVEKPLEEATEDEDAIQVDEAGDGFDPGEMRLAIELSVAESPTRTAFDLPRTAGECSSSPSQGSSREPGSTDLSFDLAGGDVPRDHPSTLAEAVDLAVIPESPTLPQDSTLPPVPNDDQSTPQTTTLAEEDGLIRDLAPPFLRRSDDTVANLPETTEAAQTVVPDAPVDAFTDNRMWLAMPEPDWPDNLYQRYGHNEITSATPVIVEPFREPDIPSFTLTPPTPKDAVSFAQQDGPRGSRPSAKSAALLGIPPKNSTRDDRRRNSWHAEPKPALPKPFDPLLPSAIAINNTERMLSRLERQWEQSRKELEETIDRINKRLGLEPLKLPLYGAEDDKARREARRRKERLAEIEGERGAGGSDMTPGREDDLGRRSGIDQPRSTDNDRPRLSRSLSHHLLGVRNIDNVSDRRDELRASRPAPRPPTPEDLRLRRVKLGDTPQLSHEFDTPPGGTDTYTDTIMTPQTLSHPRLRIFIPQPSAGQEAPSAQGPSSTASSQDPRDVETDPRSPSAPKRVRFAEGASEIEPLPRVGITEVVIDAFTAALGQLWRSFTGGPRQ